MLLIDMILNRWKLDRGMHSSLSAIILRGVVLQQSMSTTYYGLQTTFLLLPITLTASDSHSESGR